MIIFLSAAVIVLAGCASQQTVETVEEETPAFPEEGLEGHFNFENPDNLAEDSTGLHTGGIAEAGVTQVPGLYGMAAKFEESIEGQIRIPMEGGAEDPLNRTVNTPGGGQTYSLWIRSDMYLGNSQLIAHPAETTNGRPWHSLIWTSDHPSDGLKGNVWDNQGEEIYTFAEYPNLSDGKWHHIVMRIDLTAGKTSPDQLRLFIDGEPVNDSISGPGYDSHVMPGLGDLIFGYAPDTRRLYSGEMDNVRIYSRALSDAEIMLLYLEEPYETE
jgi:hypothetical protein